MSPVIQWGTVERPDGLSLEVRRALEGAGDDELEPRVYGIVRVTEQGWVAEAPSGVAYGPFATMGEAAYPLALAGEGHDARLLLGEPLPGGRLPRRALAVPAGPPPRSRVARLVPVGLAAVAVLAAVVERRITRS